MLNIVLLLTYSICRHPDITLESEPVPHTIWDLNCVINCNTNWFAWKLLLFKTKLQFIGPMQSPVHHKRTIYFGNRSSFRQFHTIIAAIIIYPMRKFDGLTGIHFFLYIRKFTPGYCCFDNSCIIPVLVIMSAPFFTGPSYGDAACLGKKCLCGIPGTLSRQISVPPPYFAATGFKAYS